MAKTLFRKRSQRGMTVKEDTINHVIGDLRQAENQGDTLTTLECLLSLGPLHFVADDYEEAEPPLAKYVAIAKNEFGS